MKTRYSALVAVTVCALVLTTGCSDDEGQRVLRLLTWVGYDEPAFLGPLEEELDAKIEVTTYVGGDQMYTLFTTAPEGTYDAVVVDAEYGERMFREGLIRSLDRAVWYDDDLFEIFQTGRPAVSDESVYAAVMRWGALGLVFNHERVDREAATSYEVLWDSRHRNRVVLFDWYLPVMGVMSVAAGNTSPFALSTQEFEDLKDSLRDLGPQVATIHSGTGQVIEDLRAGTATIGPGIGEWAAAVLAEEGKPIDWIVPEEGGVMWIEGFAIPSSARHPELAETFIRTVRQPEHLARLAWRNAYHSQVVREGAYAHLTEEQRRLLKATEIEDLRNLISRLHVRRLPSGQFGEEDWLAAWQDFKARAH